MNTQTKQNYFLSQPHQPFFVLAIINAVVMMLIFALNYKGVLTLQDDTLSFHVYSLIFLVFSNAFTGFLFTTFPRFCQAEVIDKKYYSNIFYANAFGSLVFLAGAFISHILLIFAMAILFVSQVFIVLKLRYIYQTGIISDKKDSFWILNAQYFGVFGSFLFVLSAIATEFGLNFDILTSAINISFYMYLIFLAFSVAQRMVPFFSHSFAQKNSNFIKFVFILFLLKSLFASLDFTIAQIIVDVLLGAYMLIEFRRWELHPFSSPAILWVLHLALFWLPTAFFLSALSLVAQMLLHIDFFFLNTHLLAIGFLTTVLIGFGTRVILGHSGQAPHADRVATYIFWFIQVVVLLRVLYSFNIAFGWDKNFLFDISFTAWLVLFLVWGARYIRVLIFGSKQK